MTTGVIGLLNISIAIFLILVAIPLIKGWIRKNYLYGFRFRKALESEENWYRINQFGAKTLLRWSSLLLITGVVALFIPANKEQITLYTFLFFVIPVLLVIIIPAILTNNYAKKL